MMRNFSFKHYLGITALVVGLLGTCEWAHAQSTQSAPKFVPQHKQTGDPIVDAEAYKKEREAWLKAHPEANTPTVKPAAAKADAQPAHSSQVDKEGPAPTNAAGKHDVSAAPKVQTYSEAEENARIAAKTEWIKQNPEEYRKSGGDPDAVLNPSQGTVVTKMDKPTADHGTFAALQAFQLVKIEAVPMEGVTSSPDELQKEKANIELEFPANTQLQKGANGQIRLYAPGKHDLRAIETRNGDKVKWDFSVKDCAECSKMITLTLVSESAEKLTYLMLGEDEGAAFAYQLTFQPTTTH